MSGVPVMVGVHLVEEVELIRSTAPVGKEPQQSMPSTDHVFDIFSSGLIR